MASPQAREVPSLLPLPGPSSQAFEAWVQAVGEVRPSESFGDLVVRVGRVQLGAPYAHALDSAGVEVLDLGLGAFQCVSFVESTLALSRCIWLGTPRGTCFANELVSLRYRSGIIDGFVSRLHYYEEWLVDNEARGHLNLVTSHLGGERLARPAQFMSHHPALYPPMGREEVKNQIAAMETRVSTLHPYVIDRRRVQSALPWLQTGDIVAVTTRQPDLLISHTGFLERLPDGSIHLLHASSAHGHVLVTPETLAKYIMRRPARQGILVGRPIAPRGATGVAKTTYLSPSLPASKTLAR